MSAEYITFHNTYNDATAEGEVSYMVGNNNEVSFHFAVDDKQVVQGIPVNRNAWHAGDSKFGDGNRKSIGVEVCYSKSGGAKYKKAEALAIKFIAQLLHERGWGVDRVKTHKHWTEVGLKKGYSSYVKNCPHRVLDEGRWNEVIKAIEKELKALKGEKESENKPTSPVKPVSKPKLDKDVYGTVKVLVANLNVREKADFTSKVVQVAKKGASFKAYAQKNGLYHLGGKKYVTANTKYVKFTKNPNYGKESKAKVLTVLVSELYTYKTANWDDKGKIVKKNDVYTIVKELTVAGAKMYQIKSGLYITANPKYVKVSTK